MKRILLFLLLAPAFLLHAYADDLDTYASEVIGTHVLEDGLTREEMSISGSYQGGGYDVKSALSRLWSTFADRLNTEAKEGLSFFVHLLAVTLLCALSAALCPDEKVRGFIEICGTCLAASVLLGSMDSLVSATTEAIYRMSDYSKAALPVVFTAAAASGAVTSSAMRYAGVSFALDVMMSLTHRAVIPLIYAYLSLALTNVLFPHPLLGSVSRLAKWAATTVMTGATLAFTVYLSMTGAISGKVDAAAVKTTRSVISGALPVVGGLVADASAAVLSAAALVRNCSGVFGLIAVSAICVGPFAVLTVRTLLFKIAAALSDAVDSPRLRALFGGIGSAVAMLMGLLGCSAVMLFLSYTAAMKAVTA